MSDFIDAIIVGAGRFARNYVSVLNEINEMAVQGIPKFRTLFVSRTRFNDAQTLADEIRVRFGAGFAEVVGVEITDLSQLRSALTRIQPGLICITARDRHMGDAIHALYAGEAVRHGYVLCEKPFSSALGDGASLEYLGALARSPHSHRFGLELPMAVVALELCLRPDYRALWGSAQEAVFWWEKPLQNKLLLLADLALHPWSLIPPTYTCTITAYQDGSEMAWAEMMLERPNHRHPIRCRMFFRSGGSLRGIQLDDTALGFSFEKGKLKVIRLPWSLEQVAQESLSAGEGDVVVAVENPLRQHLIALLKGQPITGIGETALAQLFLERLAGYKGRGNFDFAI